MYLTGTEEANSEIDLRTLLLFPEPGGVNENSE